MKSLKFTVAIILLAAFANVAWGQGKIVFTKDPATDKDAPARITLDIKITPDTNWKINTKTGVVIFGEDGGKVKSTNDTVSITVAGDGSGTAGASYSGNPNLKSDTLYYVTVEVQVYEVGNETNFKTLVTVPKSAKTRKN